MTTKRKFPSKKSENIYAIIPLILIIAIVPLIIYINKIYSTDTGYMYWDGLDTHYDIFSYSKMVFLLIFTVAAGLAFAATRPRDIFQKDRLIYYIPIGIYALFVVLSALASQYKFVSAKGYIERYEGAYVLVAYMVLLFISINMLKSEKAVKVILSSLFASAFVISIIGLFQLFGVEYIKSDFVQSLIKPGFLQGFDLQFNLEPNTIYSTLYNSNYVGSYVAMLLPISIILLLWFKNIYYKVSMALFTCLLIINSIGCKSRAGIVGCVFALLVIIVIFRKKIFSNKKIVFAGLGACIVLMIIINFATHGILLNTAKSLLSMTYHSTAGSLTTANPAFSEIKDIKMDSNTVDIITSKGTLHIGVKSNNLVFIDESSKTIKFSINGKSILFNDERFKDFKMEFNDEKSAINIYFKDALLYNVAFTKEGFNSTSNRWMTERNGRAIESFGPKGLEQFGSGRGYIWSRSIPLLKDTIFIGHGPDTFPMFFPQYDYMGKLSIYNTGNIFVDKPHNMFLQIALNTGIISLLAILLIFIAYFISSMKLYLKADISSFLQMAGLSCFIAVCGYVAAALFNDSVISVAPVFWVLLGMGIGINFKLKEPELDNAKEIKNEKGKKNHENTNNRLKRSTRS